MNSKLFIPEFLKLIKMEILKLVTFFFVFFFVYFAKYENMIFNRVIEY